MENQARRFINLVDEFYDRGVKLILSAATSPLELYQGRKLKFEFQRTVSRLLRCSRTSTWNDRTCHKSRLSGAYSMTTPGDPSNRGWSHWETPWTTRSGNLRPGSIRPRRHLPVATDPENIGALQTIPRQPEIESIAGYPPDAWWQPDFWTTHVHPTTGRSRWRFSNSSDTGSNRARIPLPPPRRPRYLDSRPLERATRRNRRHSSDPRDIPGRQRA